MAPDLMRQVLRFDQIHDAWENVRANGGMAGGDSVTLKRFRHRLDEELLGLIDEAQSGDYRPGPARRVHMRTGGKIRTLTVPPVRDRVLQRAVLDVLTPRIDPHFLHCSYGYRPGRSLHGAVQRIVTLRDRGLTAIVDADIRNCFGTLDHRMLAEVVAKHVPDLRLRELIALWYLPAPGVLRPRPAPSRGIELGAPISPLLCNMYLHQLDTSLIKRRLHLVRYADDFVVACRSPEEADRALRTVEKVLRGIRLAPNPAKTRLTSFAEGFTFLGVHFEGEGLWFEHRGMRIDIERTLPPDFPEWPTPYDNRWR